MTTPSEWTARIECKVDADPRLIAGAAVIAEHMARRAGIAGATANQFSAAVVQACNVLTASSGEASQPRNSIQFAAAEFPDHVEATISFPSAAPDPKQPKRPSHPAELAEKLREKLNSAFVDDVQVEVKNGCQQVTLVKNCGVSSRRFVV